MVTLQDGRQVPGGGDVQRVVTGQLPRPQLVPQVKRLGALKEGRVCNGRPSQAKVLESAWHVVVLQH